VEELIAPDTVNTLPPSTMDAFRDHGRVRASLEKNVDRARQMMATLDRSCISIDAVTTKLVDEGVQLFAEAFDKLLGAVSRKRAVRLGQQLDSQTSKLAPDLEKTVTLSFESWRRDAKVRRLWAGDASLWTSSDEAKWLGWLGIADAERTRIDALSRLAEDIPQAELRPHRPPRHGGI
jgi:transaldolase/glucose-6-phosphate isomerase